MKKDLSLEMLDENIEVAKLSFQRDDFQLMNIIGNRIMSDSLFGGTKDFSLLGFFIKQVALNYLNLKPRLDDSDFLGAKLVGEKYLDTLLSTSQAIDKVQLWANYHEFNIQIVQYSASEVDEKIKEIYRDAPQVTEHVRHWLIDFLNNKRDILFDARNNFIKGIINEFQRVGLSYGYQVMDTIIFSCLIALDRYWEYFIFQHATASGEVDKETVRTTVFPYIDKIKQISSSSNINYDDVTKLLSQLIEAWRESFIYYHELPRKVLEKPVELSEESKKKLSAAVGKALQKEVKT
jgi:hypothetical protein